MFNINKIKTYFNEVRLEFKKVTWPSRPILKQLTIFVLFLIFLLTIFTWVIDFSISNLVSLLLRR